MASKVFFICLCFSGAEVSDCGRYVILSIRQGCDPVNQLYYCDLQSLEAGIKGIFSLFFIGVCTRFRIVSLKVLISFVNLYL